MIWCEGTEVKSILHNINALMQDGALHGVKMTLLTNDVIGLGNGRIWTKG